MRNIKSRKPNTSYTKKKNDTWKYVVSVLIILAYLLPLYVLLLQSFKSKNDMSAALTFPKVWYVENYIKVLKNGTMLKTIKNSAIVAVGSVFLEIIVASAASYPLARNQTKFNEMIRSTFLGVMMIPPLTILVGVYTLLVNLHATNSYWGIILTNATFGLPFAVFLLTNFISSIPKDLDEAAILDGCGVVRTFFSIIMPQLKPVVSTLVIMHGVRAWNEYAYSIYLLQKPSLQTITLCIKKYFSGTTNDYGGAAAAAIMGILPLIVIYVLLQDQFIQSQVDSAIK